MRKLDAFSWTALILLLIGGIAWGFIGLFNFNFVAAIFGGVLSRIIYIIVGIAACYVIYLLYQERKTTKVV